MAELTNQSPENCTHDCSTCGSNCSQRRIVPDAPNRGSHVRHLIAVVSGKGGVGKSMVTSLLAVATQRSGRTAGILDADVTGPSIPKAFGVREDVTGNGEGMIPPVSSGGIPVMSANLLLKTETTPVVWRGPVVSGMVRQFWSDVVWGDLDYLYVDLPPGTGDVPLTVFQSLPVSGIVIVTSPQDLVSMIVEKALNMASLMKIPVIGIVENYSYFRCPDCGGEHYIFGKGKTERVALEHGVPLLAKIPIDPELAELSDAGKIEQVTDGQLSHIEAVVGQIFGLDG